MDTLGATIGSLFNVVRLFVLFDLISSGSRKNDNLWKSLGGIMLYGTEGGGRGRKSKYMVLPRGGRVKFDFLNAPAGWPSPIDKPAKADRSGNRTRRSWAEV